MSTFGNFAGRSRQEVLFYSKIGQGLILGFDDKGSSELSFVNSPWRTSWTVMVSGAFLGIKRDQVLLYDRTRGEAEVVGFDDYGTIILSPPNKHCRTSS